MTEAHYRRSTCRLCDSTDLVLRVPMAASPIGGAFVSKDRLDQPQDLYPLDLYQCHDCGHVQLLDVVNPALLWADYSYQSGRTGLVHHFAKYADSVISRHALDGNSFVVDIGSNDGSFLKFFADRGIKVLGIDPAENIAEIANRSGVPTLPIMFDLAAAERIRHTHGPASVITANNVFAHVDDMQGMLASVRALLADDGLFYFEVSYLIDVIDKMLLGAIFHEHLCYHTVKPLVSFLERGGFELIDVERVSIQGGSLICAAQLRGGKRAVAPAVAELIQLEQTRGVYAAEFFADFHRRLSDVKESFAKLIANLTSAGQRMAAYGASRGGTLITYALGLGPHIDFIVDDEASKWGQFSPGWHIPVLPVSELYTRKPDYVAVLAWVHSKAIVQNNARFLNEGGKFVTFFPSMQVIDSHSPV